MEAETPITQNWNTVENQGELNVTNLPSSGIILTLPINTEPNNIEFRKQGKPILSFNNNGDIFINGRLVENDKEVVDGMRQFLTTSGIIK